ncbi:hypothetical protein AXG93_3255s1000 [Marchantia polymorpha subsp. ruderalis]|uniref:Uncharacterized protein n=1 Tax=Marchantia polymorpha subsp. ruderalis TaxID=1480154 RepID=A0A176VRT5_MARPO|nr:hypothetical protein AXG93_3255s1000 [Marchantia polymorpha subsp. ruderalis]
MSRLRPKGQRLRRCIPLYERLRRHRIKIRSTSSGQATPYSPSSAERLRQYGHVRLRRNGTPAAKAPSGGQERSKEMTRPVDYGQRLRLKRIRRCTYVDARLQGYAFGATGQRLRWKMYAFGQRNVESDAAADDFAEATADWVARFPARADCGEAQFPPVGVELGVLGHDERSLSYECRKLLLWGLRRKSAFGGTPLAEE